LWYYIPVNDSSNEIVVASQFVPYFPCHRCWRKDCPMRVVRSVRAALAAGSTSDLALIGRWAAVGATAAAIAAAVLFASFLGVALGLA
jgi:hypothetical protein